MAFSDWDVIEWGFRRRRVEAMRVRRRDLARRVLSAAAVVVISYYPLFSSTVGRASNFDPFTC